MAWSERGARRAMQSSERHVRSPLLDFEKSHCSYVTVIVSNYLELELHHGYITVIAWNYLHNVKEMQGNIKGGDPHKGGILGFPQKKVVGKGTLTLRNQKARKPTELIRNLLDWHSLPSLAFESRLDRCENCSIISLLGRAVPLMNWNTRLLHHTLPCQPPITHMFHGDCPCLTAL